MASLSLFSISALLSLLPTSLSQPIGDYTVPRFTSGPWAGLPIPYASGAGANLISYVNLTNSQLDSSASFSVQPLKLQNLTSVPADAPYEAYFPAPLDYGPTVDRTNINNRFTIPNPKPNEASSTMTLRCTSCDPGAAKQPQTSTSSNLFDLAPGDSNWSQIFLAATQAYFDVLTTPVDDVSPYKFAAQIMTGGTTQPVCSTLTIEGLQKNSQTVYSSMAAEFQDARWTAVEDNCKCKDGPGKGGVFSATQVLSKAGVPKWRMMIQTGGFFCQ